MEVAIMADKKSTPTPRRRKLPSGMWLRGNAYYARFRANGRVVRKKLSTDYRVACELLAEMQARAARADFGIIDNNVPLDEVRDQYLPACSQSVRSSTLARYRQNFANLWEGIPSRRVSQINVKVITNYRAARLTDGAARRTVNMEVSALSTMLTWAVDHEVIGSNPLTRIKALPIDDNQRCKIRRALSVEEVEAIFEYSPPRLRPIWVTFMTTGLRHGELVNMRFEDVDFDRGVATVRSHNAKNHKARDVPLSEEVLEIIAQLKRDAPKRKPVVGRTRKQTEQQRANFSKKHVFVTGANTPWRNNLLRTFYAVCDKAGIEGAHRCGSVDIHSLRVSFTTLSLEHGANPKAVQAILGHSTLALTMEVYAKATDRSKREAVSVLPFATASTPRHVVPMRTRTVTSPENSAQLVVG
jgi:integrase